MYGWKLFRKRKNGTIGPLFINRRQVLELDRWYKAEDHPTKGYAHRPGWHVCSRRTAPHLSKKGRIWKKVEIEKYYGFARPGAQGGIWYLAEFMRIVK